MGHFQLIKLRATTSTNDYLKKKVLNHKAMNPCVVWALHQTNGKGQANKTWLSTPNRSLTFSIYKTFSSLSPSQHFMINVLASLTTLETLNAFGIDNPKIKWSNDIMADNCKIAGILIENLIESSQKIGSIIGVGINVNNKQPYEGIKMTSMQMVTGKSFELEDILNHFLTSFSHFCKRFQEERFDFILEDFSNSLWSRTHFKTLIVNGQSIRGRVYGLNIKGHLLIELVNYQKVVYPHHQVKILP
ncbi:MAG: biotin--[acetyl-CoA-carboxylase] ligase [Flavobacteriaceae bacterium]|nr:biotin--[acetyl-CoA-carboxylase] ligase [Flavobacteriaceae bacterium]MCY4216972.1 biotin--[acetyl-CoA-carboxylase] ligase [Flavobacteriaceae bacterium]MCY4253599.1 biotin--[acetyl-CoA-carboxylase] ligase [Flavobacteriaceae bacterium]